MKYKFFVKKTGSEVTVNEPLAQELHKPGTKKFKRRKVYATFKDNIWVVYTAETRSLLSKIKMLNNCYVP